MNIASIYTLKFFKKVYNKIDGKKKPVNLICEASSNAVADIISRALESENPSMIARVGATELACMKNYLGLINPKHNIFKYISGKTPPWWWEKSIVNQMEEWSGFFPATDENIEKFCKLMIEDIQLIDVLGSWLPDEQYFEKELANSKKVHFELLNPYFSDIPWTNALKGKKVLVIHPFAATIEHQYKKRKLLFANDLLPDFELKTIKAVQSIAGNETPFKDWFAALDFMKAEIEKVDFDICLIGCGAYGLPLAAHVKRLGKKGFHMGGSLQLLFGIKGKRWENENYNKQYNFAKLMNEYWVKPGDEERPKNANSVENACYW